MRYLKGAAPCPPWDERFPTGVQGQDQEFRKVPSANVVSFFNFFDNDPNVDACRRIRMDSMLNGGFIMRLNGTEVGGRFKNWLTRELTKVTNAIYRSRCAVGFVACSWIPHPNFIGLPVVLDLTQLQIEVKHDVYGQLEYRYWETITK